MKNLIKKTFSILLGTLIALIIAEVVLRIYNPLQSRFKGDHVQLITNYHRKVEIENLDSTQHLDQSFNYTTNNIGFRGNNFTDSTDSKFKIITVGGSTTECSLLNNTKTWSFLLNKHINENNNKYWLNNGGMDGASTYAHQLLLDEHIVNLKPNMVIFLVGINDVFQSILNMAPNIQERREKLNYWSSKSELFSFSLNFYRQIKAKGIDATHFQNNTLKSLNEIEYQKNLSLHNNAQKAYKARLIELINTCKENNIEPVIVSQPYLDSGKHHPYSFVTIYNQSSQKIAQQFHLQFIDLYSLLENDRSYYYDDMHYNILGAKEVAKIIFNNLQLP